MNSAIPSSSSSNNNNDDEDVDALFAQIFKDLAFLKDCGQYECDVCGGSKQEKRKTLPDDERDAKKLKQNEEEQFKESTVSVPEMLPEFNARDAPKHATSDRGQGSKCLLARTDTPTIYQMTNNADYRQGGTRAATLKSDSKIWAQIFSEKQSERTGLVWDSSGRNDQSLPDRQQLCGRGEHQENIQVIQEPAMELGRAIGQVVSNPEVLDGSTRLTPVGPHNEAGFIHPGPQSDTATSTTTTKTSANSKKPTAVVFPTIAKASQKSSTPAYTARSSPRPNQRRSTLNVSTTRQALAPVDQNAPAQRAHNSIARVAPTAPLSLPQTSSSTLTQTSSLTQTAPSPTSSDTPVQNSNLIQTLGQTSVSHIRPAFVSSVVSSYIVSHRFPDNTAPILHHITSRSSPIDQRAPTVSRNVLSPNDTPGTHQPLPQIAHSQLPSTLWAGPSSFQSGQNRSMFSPTLALVLDNTTRLSQDIPGVTQNDQRTAPWPSHQ